METIDGLDLSRPDKKGTLTPLRLYSPEDRRPRRVPRTCPKSCRNLQDGLMKTVTGGVIVKVVVGVCSTTS